MLDALHFLQMRLPAHSLMNSAPHNKHFRDFSSRLAPVFAFSFIGDIYETTLKFQGFQYVLIEAVFVAF